MTGTALIDASTWRSLTRDRLLLALIGAHVLLKVAVFPTMADVHFTGDETFYVEGGMTLSNVIRDLLHLRAPDFAEVSANIVGNGWFMPGTSVLLTPLFLVDPDPGLAIIRAYMGVSTTVLLLVTAGFVHRHLGRAYALTLLVFPGLVPMWLMFSYTTWGDLTAGLLLVILLATTVGFARAARHGVAPTLLAGAGFGCVAIASLYSRSSLLPLLAGLFALLTIGAVTLLRAGARNRGLLAVAVAAATFAGLLLPWSLAASKVFDEPVATTTSVPMALGVTFGDKQELCFGRCDRGNIWFTTVRYSREVAEVTGVSELVIQQQMSEHARRGLTAQHYACSVLENARRYLLHPTEFEDRLGPDRPAALSRIIVTVSWAAYAVFLAAFVAGMLVVVRRGFHNQVTSLLVKLFGGALLLQPFVHISHGRYWPTAAPIFAVAATLLVQLVRDRRRRPLDAAQEPGPDVDPNDGGRAARFLTWAQALAAGGLLLVVLAVVGLAAS